MQGIPINEPTPAIAKAHKRWKRNRDIIEGEDAVKAAKTAYLPKLAGQSDDEYAKYLFRCPFFAGSSRTHDGLKGLVTRKAASIVVPPGLESVFETITREGCGVEDLAEDVVSETLTTGFTGLLVDHPAPIEGLTMDRALASNFRPFVHIYRAESILEVTAGVVANVQKIVRVRLLEDEDTVLELRLDDGVYTVTKHVNIEGVWTQVETVTPMRAGVALDTIPFVLVSMKSRSFDPVKGPLDDVVRSNLHLYLEQADAKNSRFYSSAPILTIMGAEAREDLVISPGTVLQFPSHTKETPVEVKFAEFSGAGQETLENAVRAFKDEMAQLGSRMLAAEKADAEATETLALRNNSENATLASLARRISERITEALGWVAWWMGASEDASFELSTDFLPTPLTAQEMAAWQNLCVAGLISHETLLGVLKAGEVLPENLDIDEEKQRISEDSMNADRPSPELPQAPKE